MYTPQSWGLSMNKSGRKSDGPRAALTFPVSYSSLLRHEPGFVLASDSGGKFEEKSLAALKNDVSDVLFTDISGFYENIDLQHLANTLRQAGVDTELLSLLSNCLNRWSHPRAKGISQGYSSSDILAKIYLNTVDRRLSTSGFTHLRYNDDFRIFCSSALAAREALLELNILLHNRGLNPQPIQD